MLIASGLTASFVVAGLSAWRLLRVGEDASARKTLRTGLLIAAVLAPVQVFVGDQHGLNTLEHQPAKIAAIEAIWKTEKSVPLVLLAIPDEDKRRNDLAIEIPKGASLLFKHDADAELKGIDAFAPDTAPVAPVLRVPRDGGHRRADVHRRVVGCLGDAPRNVAVTLDAVDVLGFHLLGWLATVRVARHRDRQAALARHRYPENRRCREGASGAQLGASLTSYVITYTGHARRLHGRADPPGRKGAQA
jgi:cytochrome d ubiquinol oxidase subunit I